MIIHLLYSNSLPNHWVVVDSQAHRFYMCK